MTNSTANRFPPEYALKRECLGYAGVGKMEDTNKQKGLKGKTHSYPYRTQNPIRKSAVGALGTIDKKVDEGIYKG